MFVDKYAHLNGRKRLITGLAPKSKYKVKVKCPSCKEVREVTYLSIARAGHHKCLSCVNKENNTIQIPKGARYGKLKVIGQSSNSRNAICYCECGKKVEVNKYNLQTGKTKSCGCLKSKAFIGVPVSKGSDHWNWQGGISSERARFMATKEYKDWRTSVFERDNFACLKCNQWGGELNAHHIKDYEHHVEGRLNIDNGATLCGSCHMEFHTIYGRKITNEEMFLEFLEKEEVAHNG